MGITREELSQSIKKLIEAQEKSSKEVDAKFREVAEAQRKNKEARRKSKEEFDKGIQEQKDLNKEIQKSLHRFIGESGRQWDRLIETLTSTEVLRLLKDRGIDVEYVVRHVKDENPLRKCEIDVLTINEAEMVAIEAKKRLSKEDIDIAKEGFQTFKRYNKDAQRKTLYGAVAYLDCDEKVNLYAQRQGFFVFQVTGNSAAIENKAKFQPTPIEPLSK